MNVSPRLVVVGTSAGGVEALQRFLRVLPDVCRVPVIIIQHLPPSATVDVRLVFSSVTSRRLVEAEDKTPLEEGAIYFAPPGYHCLVEKEGTIALSADPPVNFSRPSIDVLFESAARSFGSRVAAVLMTGANSDGAIGMKAIADAGGSTYVQDPETAYADAMPRSALEVMHPDAVLDIEGIAWRLAEEIGGLR